MRGAHIMKVFEPDLIVALGGGSAMDAAKAMWIYYEHPQLTTLEQILPPHPFPTLRNKARLLCIPSTSGTASEVSRSVVISDGGKKVGLGNMEMMPDIAICDPIVTKSMPPSITADTGMDALTHALEALASTRANYVSDVLATQAAIDIINTLPTAFKNGNDMKAREIMLNASMVAGMAFTNVSLGIVHSMAHTLGSYFHVAHGLADAILLPYIIRFNSKEKRAKTIYDNLVKKLGKEGELADIVADLNATMGIPKDFSSIIKDRESYITMMKDLTNSAICDGCTKTNPIVPTLEQFEQLFIEVFPEN
jgi:alcohol dehydrogenase class IV